MALSLAVPAGPGKLAGAAYFVRSLRHVCAYSRDQITFPITVYFPALVRSSSTRSFTVGE